MIKKFYIVSDKNKKSFKIKSYIKKKIKSVPILKAKAIIVIGGDGFMLHSLKKLYKFKIPFYGINSGNYGFLMNKFNIKDFEKNLKKSKTIQIYPLKMTVKTKTNQIKKSIAINEVSILRQSRQTTSVKITSGKKNIIKNLISDGVLVSTPAGSTAYNLSVHGPILSLNSRKVAITPISPFRPRRWKGRVVSSSSLIEINNLNINKRPVSVVADNFEVRNVKKVKIKINNAIKFTLLYDRNSILTKKIKIEQLRKQIH